MRRHALLIEPRKETQVRVLLGIGCRFRLGNGNT